MSYEIGHEFTEQEQARYDELFDALEAEGYQIWSMALAGSALGGVFFHPETDKQFCKLLDGVLVGDAAQAVIAGKVSIQEYMQKVNAARDAAPAPATDPFESKADRREQFDAALKASGFVASPYASRDGSREVNFDGQIREFFDEETGTMFQLPICVGVLSYLEIVAFADGDDASLTAAIKRVQRNQRIKKLSKAFQEAGYKLQLGEHGLSATREGSMFMPIKAFEYLENGTPALEELLQSVKDRASF